MTSRTNITRGGTIAVLMALSAPPVIAQSVIQLMPKVPGGAVHAKEKFNVALNTDMAGAKGENLAALTVGISWNPKVATLDSIKQGNYGTLVANSTTAAAGTAKVSVFAPNGTKSNVTLATLYFTAAAAGKTDLTIAPSAAGNEVGTVILPNVKATPGHITILK